MESVTDRPADTSSASTLHEDELGGCQPRLGSPSPSHIVVGASNPPTGGLQLALRQAGGLDVVIDQLSEFVFFKDRKNINLLVNQAVADSLGTTPEQIAGTPTERWFPEHAERYYEDDMDVLRSGEPKRDIVEPIVDGQGISRMYRTDKFPLRDEFGEVFGVLVIAQEISRHDTLRTQLARNARIDALSRLASGAAHDLRNFFWIIEAHLARAQSLLPAGHDAISDLTAVANALNCCNDLTNRLLTLGRPNHRTRESKRLAGLVQTVADFLKGVLPANVSVLVSSDGDDAARVLVDTVQITEVLINLALNARDAMPDGGLLHLRTDANTDDAANPRATIEVRDTGSGLTDAALAHAFDPYFTTKPDGLGLGLASCRDIVLAHGGDIALQSTLGLGTTVSISLPLMD